ncbi:oxidoreductase [Ectobacillus sp. JY-23]|uniref:oxidoreductase n=1 Tax=Ectobacillus sp. JY-23 TaxID=2933872 RepID=UPI001FF66354|nr:oxidoreductase [Ectobacillus sp. JY-23]UOY92045.1 oxidoreductase [Ectobacillus sp. JY-23]
MKRTALLLGASGLVGSELLQILLASEFYQKITVLVRRKLHINHPKLVQIEIDFERMQEYGAHFEVDDVFSCLGTTIKKAKTQENFKKIDYGYTLAAGNLAKQYKAKQFLVISSINADASASVFYSRVKGETEEDLKKLHLPSLHIFRPSLLLGDRQEFRLGEKIAEKISTALPFLFKGPLRKYKPVHAKDVAGSMYKAALTEKNGIHTYESHMLHQSSD